MSLICGPFPTLDTFLFLTLPGSCLVELSCLVECSLSKWPWIDKLLVYSVFYEQSITFDIDLLSLFPLATGG